MFGIRERCGQFIPLSLLLPPFSVNSTLTQLTVIIFGHLEGRPRLIVVFHSSFFVFPPPTPPPNVETIFCVSHSCDEAALGGFSEKSSRSLRLTLTSNPVVFSLVRALCSPTTVGPTMFLGNVRIWYSR